MYAGLWHTTAVLPAFLAGSVVIVYLLVGEIDPDQAFKWGDRTFTEAEARTLATYVAVFVGTVIGLLLWLLTAFLARDRLTPRHANQSAFDELDLRTRLLKDRLASWQTGTGAKGAAAPPSEEQLAGTCQAR